MSVDFAIEPALLVQLPACKEAVAAVRKRAISLSAIACQIVMWEIAV